MTRWNGTVNLPGGGFVGGEYALSVVRHTRREHDPEFLKESLRMVIAQRDATQRDASAPPRDARHATSEGGTTHVQSKHTQRQRELGEVA